MPASFESREQFFSRVFCFLNIWLIERVNSRPDLQNDPEFADRVSDLGHELQKLEDIGSQAVDNAEKIGLLSSEALDPESARQQTDDLNKEGEARSAFTKAVSSFHAALQSVRTLGLSTERRASLDTSITRLTDLLQSSLGKLPGAERIRNYSKTHKGITVLAGRMTGVESGLRGVEASLKTQHDYVRTLIERGLKQ